MPCIGRCMARFTKSYTHTGVFADNVVKAFVNHYHDYNTSSKVNGVLQLRPQALVWQHRTMSTYDRDPPGSILDAIDATNAPTANWPYDLVNWTSLYNEAYARFKTKARKGNANLGVSLASYGQSRKMVIDRATKLSGMFREVELNVRRMPAHKRRYALYKGTASNVLEGFFGWAPLVSDIQSAMEALTAPIPDGWMSGRKRASIDLGTVTKAGSGSTARTQRRRRVGYANVTLNARVVLTNPNLYLANRLGLLNLPGVAWDLVPWSFVVNMFTNMNAIVSSYTDFVGLSLSGINRTDTSFVKMSDWQTFDTKFGWAHSETTHYTKERILLSDTPPPTFKLRVPQFDLSLGAIALSLVVQRIDSIDRILRSTSK